MTGITVIRIRETESDVCAYAVAHAARTPPLPAHGLAGAGTLPRAWLCTYRNTHPCSLDLASDRRAAFSIVLVGNQIADFVLARARLTLRRLARRTPGSAFFTRSAILGAGHVLVGQGGCGLPTAMLWPIPHCLPAPSQQPPAGVCARRAGHGWSAPDDSSSAFGTIGRSRTPTSSGSRASRLTSVSGFHQVDSMAISEATFRHGLVGSTWPGGCVEPLSSAWPAVSLVGAGA
jgi:hypothetical protein